MVTTMKEINHFFERRQVQLGMNFGLSRMETLLTELGDPHKALKYIHIAGSNGKGSTLQYIKEILACPRDSGRFLHFALFNTDE